MSSVTTEKITIIKDWLGTGSINLFGIPFSGKDTQGKKLAELLDASLLGGGDILRNSEIPTHVKEIMHAGGLIPTEDYLQIVLPYLSKPDFADKPMILSSVGRWYGEETGVIQATNAANHPQKAVINLEIDERVVWRRFESLEKVLGHERGKRHDDDAETLQVRLEEFRVKTKPVLDFYESVNLLIHINADQSPEEVSNEIIEKLAEYAGR